jgi:hypothetical protein
MAQQSVVAEFRDADVYWAKQGRISVDVAIGGIAAAGSVFAALPVLRKVDPGPLS